ncbi:MAG: hypothetical protein WBL27_02245 [Salinimicrobium sp.]
MKKQIKISFLSLALLSAVAFSQEKEKPVTDMQAEELGQNEDAFQEHFFEALKQKAIENYEKAIDELVQALAIDAKPVVYLELGKNYNALDKYTEAAAYLEKAREKAPAQKAVLEELYNTYFLSQDYQKALPVVQDLVKVDNSYTEDLANLLMLNEKYDAALSLLDSLDKERGNSTYRETIRRQIYARTTNVDAQIGDLQKNISENPQQEQDYLNLIFVYSENGEAEKAFETAEKLLKVNPDSQLVHLALYKFYITQDQDEKALNSMQILLGSDQIDEVTKYQALNDFLIYVAENPQLEEQLVELVDIFSENENNTKVYKQLGDFFMEKGKKGPALDYYMTALNNESADFGLYREVIKLQLESQNFAEVAEVSSEALDIFPSQPWLYLSNAKAQNGLGNYKEAEDALLAGQDFLIDDPEMEAEFYRQFALAYAGLGAANKAADYEKRAKELKTEHVNE